MKEVDIESVGVAKVGEVVGVGGGEEGDEEEEEQGARWSWTI